MSTPFSPSTSNPQVSVPMPDQPAPRLRPNLPCEDLILYRRGNDYVNIAVPFYKASMKADWTAAKTSLERFPWLVRYSITENSDTALHIAASLSCTTPVIEFVKHLVDKMKKEDLELINRSSYTALHVAAAAGNLETAKIMLKKNIGLLDIPAATEEQMPHDESEEMMSRHSQDMNLFSHAGMVPLFVAVLNEREDMVRYLFQMPNSISGDYWNDWDRSWLVERCVEADYFDIALKIVKAYPELLTSSKEFLENLLQLLAEKTYPPEGKKTYMILGIIKSICHVNIRRVERKNGALQLLKMIAKILSKMPQSDVNSIIMGPLLNFYDPNNGRDNIHKFPSRALFVAAKLSNTRFIIELIRSCPDLVRMLDDDGLSIFHIAATRRDAETFSLLYEIGIVKDQIIPLKDKDGNNMLHLVAKRATAEQNESVVAVRMHQELLWYKEVEKLMPPSYKRKKNKNGETPYDIFKTEHKSLVTEGAKWMKDTASQCIVVATLITTMVFAAAFTLPGGNDDKTGFPKFLQKPALIVFVVADAISLIFSSTSVLVFLSMLTSRFTEKDVMETLPKKLAFGLATLFLSVVAMMIAFSASFIVLYHNNFKGIPIMVICLSTMPVLLFAFLHYHLLGDVSFPTYRSRSLLKPNKRKL